MTCALCGHRLTDVMDFGDQALAGAYLKPEDFAAEKRYPLMLSLCQSCGGVQVKDSPDADLFSSYFYASSATSTGSEHFRLYAEAINRLEPKRVLEIGCNDGALLRHLKAEVVGVDPSNRAAPGVIQASFTRELARGLGTFDVIVANNVLAHASDVHDFLRGVRACLNGGVFVFETHYLGDMIEGLQYDVIYHEHRHYFSATSLQALLGMHGMRLFDAQPQPIHGGSMRWFADKRTRTPHARVSALLDAEERLSDPGTYRQFARDAEYHRDALRLTTEIRGCYGPIVGYGAAGRANTLLQWCDLDLAYIVDDSPVRQGYWTPGTHIPIMPREYMEARRPEAVVVLAWTYAREIAPKCPYTRIVPLPNHPTLDLACSH